MKSKVKSKAIPCHLEQGQSHLSSTVSYYAMFPPRWRCILASLSRNTSSLLLSVPGETRRAGRAEGATGAGYSLTMTGPQPGYPMPGAPLGNPLAGICCGNPLTGICCGNPLTGICCGNPLTGIWIGCPITGTSSRYSNCRLS